MFYDTFKALCKEKGITIKQAAEDLGINRTTVFKWKEHAPYNKKLQLIADYFGVSTVYLLTGKENTAAQLSNGNLSAELGELFPRLTEEDQRYIISSIRVLLSKQ